MARSVRVRFEARQSDRKWWVFDRDVSSWPVERPGAGRIRQAMDTETEAQAEADRLASYYEGTSR